MSTNASLTIYLEAKPPSSSRAITGDECRFPDGSNCVMPSQFSHMQGPTLPPVFSLGTCLISRLANWETRRDRFRTYPWLHSISESGGEKEDLFGFSLSKLMNETSVAKVKAARELIPIAFCSASSWFFSESNALAYNTRIGLLISRNEPKDDVSQCYFLL